MSPRGGVSFCVYFLTIGWALDSVNAPTCAVKFWWVASLRNNGLAGSSGAKVGEVEVKIMSVWAGLLERRPSTYPLSMILLLSSRKTLGSLDLGLFPDMDREA